MKTKNIIKLTFLLSIIIVIICFVKHCSIIQQRNDNNAASEEIIGMVESHATDEIKITNQLDFDSFDWEYAQVSPDIKKSFLNNEKIIKTLYNKRGKVSEILIKEKMIGVVYCGPRFKESNNRQEQKLFNKIITKRLIDELFQDKNIMSIQFLNNGSMDIFFKQQNIDGAIYDRYIGYGETDEIVTEYSEIKRIYGNWFYTYSCLDYYTD